MKVPKIALPALRLPRLSKRTVAIGAVALFGAGGGVATYKFMTNDGGATKAMHARAAAPVKETVAAAGSTPTTEARPAQAHLEPASRKVESRVEDANKAKGPSKGESAAKGESEAAPSDEAADTSDAGAEGAHQTAQASDPDVPVSRVFFAGDAPPGTFSPVSTKRLLGDVKANPAAYCGLRNARTTRWNYSNGYLVCSGPHGGSTMSSLLERQTDGSFTFLASTRGAFSADALTKSYGVDAVTASALVRRDHATHSREAREHTARIAKA